MGHLNVTTIFKTTHDSSYTHFSIIDAYIFEVLIFLYFCTLHIGVGEVLVGRTSRFYSVLEFFFYPLSRIILRLWLFDNG